jgi:hypothetical protein
LSRRVRTVIDTILGEAVSGSPATRYADMLAIGSAIMNRAQRAGVSPLDIVSAISKSGTKQFDAWDKDLPAGAEKFAELAERAWSHLERFGPTHTGTYFATETAAKNLPSGLKEVGRTAGHIIFDDPQARPFLTSQGFRTPTLTTLPNEAPVPAAARRASGLAALVEGRQVPADIAAMGPARTDPNEAEMARAFGLTPGQIELSSLAAPNKGRPMLPASNIVGLTAQAANRVVPGATTSIFSGMEPAGNAPVGARHRHPLGYAGDFTFYGPDGNQIVDRQIMHDIAMDMAARHQANIGYSDLGEYMKAGSMHVDILPTSQFPGAGTVWGGTAAGQWADNLAFARETSIGPTPYTNAPMPTKRPDVMPVAVDPVERGGPLPPAAPAAPRAPIARMAEDQSMAAMATSPDRPLGFGPTAREAENASMADLRTNVGGINAAVLDALAKETAPAVSPAAAYGQLASTMGHSGLLGLDGRPAVTPASLPSLPPSLPTTPAPAAQLPTLPPSLPAAAPPANLAPINRPPLAPQLPPPTFVRDFPVAPVSTINHRPASQSPAGFRGAQSVYDVYSGLSESAVASNGNTVSRDAIGNTYNYNPTHDVTTISLPSGRSTTKTGNAFLDAQRMADDNAKKSASIFSPNRQQNVPMAGLFDKPNTRTGAMVRGVAGAIAGGLLGGMLGPVGGMLGSAFGQQLAVGNNPLAGRRGYFPPAPPAPANQRKGGNPSHAQMSRVSPAAANAISKGKGGLY